MQSESLFGSVDPRGLLSPTPTRGLQAPEVVVRSLSASGDRRDSLTTDQRIAQKYASLRTRQEFNHDIPPTAPRKRPMREDFGEQLANMFITSPDEDEALENAIILLHDDGGSERDLQGFHKNPLRQPKTAYLYPRGPYPSFSGTGYSWAEKGKQLHILYLRLHCELRHCFLWEFTFLAPYFLNNSRYKLRTSFTFRLCITFKNMHSDMH